MGSKADNLRVLAEALEEHDNGCPNPAIEFRMNPFEAERLGWDEFKGLPIIGDPSMETGRVRVVCDPEGAEDEEVEVVEAISAPA